MLPDAYSEPHHICENRYTLCNPGNSEPWHIDNPGLFRTLTYLKPHTYVEPSQRCKIECFAKIVKSYNYFFKTLYLRSLRRFWILPFRNKYSSASGVTSHNVLYETYSELCHIQNLHICRTWDIFRTMSKHFMVYPEYCVTFAFWKPCHIQNFNTVYLGIFRHIQVYSIMVIIIALTFFTSL